MANPQKENGYTAIANEILEKVINLPLLGSEFQMLFFIIRKTYGFHKKEDIISLTQFEKGTGLSRPTVVKTIKNLVIRKMVVKGALLGNKISFSFNKDYDKWVVNTALLVKHNGLNSKHRLTETSKHRLTHKRKKDITKETAKGVNPLIVEIIKLFEGVNPACKSLYGNTTQRQACQDLIDTYSFEVVSKAISFLPKNNSTPYKPKATTPLQLWQRWQDIKNAWQQEKATTNKNKPNYIL